MIDRSSCCICYSSTWTAGRRALRPQTHDQLPSTVYQLLYPACCVLVAMKNNKNSIFTDECLLLVVCVITICLHWCNSMWKTVITRPPYETFWINQQRYWIMILSLPGGSTLQTAMGAWQDLIAWHCSVQCRLLVYWNLLHRLILYGLPTFQDTNYNRALSTTDPSAFMA